MMTEDLWHWISAVIDWRENVEERRSSKNGKTEAGKKTRVFSRAGWSVLESITLSAWVSTVRSP